MEDLTIMPGWLHNFIYDVVGARKNNNWFKALQNLHNTHEENIEYLGTYFPRTFTEVSRIISKLRQETRYFDSIDCKKRIRILSAGCGTGGDVCGLIHALHAVKPQASFEVSLFDGNSDALEICRGVLHELSVHEDISIPIKTYIIREIRSKRDFKEIREEFSEQDIIITSKFLNEVLGYFSNAYYYFVKKFSKLLSEDGIMIINDVICRAYCEQFVPTYMNRDLNEAIRDADLSSVLPLPCRANKNCRERYCYSRFSNGAYSDYTFRVVSSEQFADSIVPHVQPNDYQIDYVKEVSCRVVA